MCRLRYSSLLDAAHILPDGHPRGAPVVPNGLSLCRIHHAAYDQNLLGVRPDLVVEVRFGRESADRRTDAGAWAPRDGRCSPSSVLGRAQRSQTVSGSKSVTRSSSPPGRPPVLPAARRPSQTRHPAPDVRHRAPAEGLRAPGGVGHESETAEAEGSSEGDDLTEPAGSAEAANSAETTGKGKAVTGDSGAEPESSGDTGGSANGDGRTGSDVDRPRSRAGGGATVPL